MANPFNKFLNFSQFNLFQRHEDRVVGVDIGTSSIKVVQLRKDKGRVILETYGELASGPYRGLSVGQAAPLQPDKLAEAIADLLKEANVNTTAASLSIPLASSLLSIIEIPKVEDINLDKVVPIEARKYVPVPISEVSLSWWVIPKQELQPENKEPTLEVLIGAVHNSAINQERELARAVGLQIAFFEIETFSAIRSVFGGDMTATVILDIGAGTTKMSIIDLGIVRVSHTIAKGSQDLTIAISRGLGVDFAKAEEIKRQVGLVEKLEGEGVSETVSSVVEYVFAEAEKIINSYQARYHKAISKIIIIGGGAQLKGLLPLAEKSFEAPVQLGRPFSKVETPAFLENILNEAGPGFAVAVGLALRHLQSLD